MFLQGPSAKNFDFILCGEGAGTITHTVARSDGTTDEMSVSSVTTEDTFLKTEKSIFLQAHPECS